ncbi:MAG: TolB family protein, partial [Nannocystaceae bacterium]
MTVQAKLLPFLVLPLCLSSACSENNAQEDILQYSDSADPAPTERAYDRAIVVDGDVIVYGNDGTSRQLNLDIEAFVAHGQVDSTHLLLGANPRAVLPHAEDLGGHDLFLVDLATSSYTQLTNEQEVVRATWNSRRNRVIVSNRSLQITEFGLENPAEVVTLVEGAVTPALSPDGQHLAYGRLPADWSVGSLPESIDLHVLDLDGGNDVELTSGFDDIEPIWTPDGSGLLFLSGARTGVQSFWQVDPSGGIPAQLTNLGLEEVTPDFVPSPAFNTEVAWSDDG